MSDLTVTKKVHFQRGGRSRKAMREGEASTPPAAGRVAKLMVLVVRLDN